MLHRVFLLMIALTLVSCSNLTNEPRLKQKVEENGKEHSNTQENLNSYSNEEKSMFPVKLIEVIDGDTIKVELNGKSESVRFLLVDTPEIKQSQPFAEEAKSFIQNVLSSNVVYLEKDVSERDKYGRLLMYIYTDKGKSVQEELLKEGLARVAYVYAPNTKYVDAYYEIQKHAQKKGVGIWSIENYAQNDGFHDPVIKNESEHGNKSAVQFFSDKEGDCNGKIKGNRGSNGWIYHVPSGAYYEKTIAEECFYTEQDAQSAGYRKSTR